MDNNKNSENIGFISEFSLDFKYLIDRMNDGLGIVDLNENFVYCNAAAEKIFGVPKNGLVGRSLFEFTNQKNAKTIKNQTRLRIDDITSSYETEIECPDKNIRILNVWASPYYSKDHEIIGTFGIFRDITQTKIMEKELHENEILMKKFQKLANIGGWVWDTSSDTMQISEEFANIFGIINYRKKVSMQTLIKQYIHPVDRRKVKLFSKNAKKMLSTSIQYRIIQPSGKIKWILASQPEISSYNSKTQKPILIGTIQDITDQKKFEEELQNMQKMESLYNLASGIGHDFNNILTSILGNISLMKYKLEKSLNSLNFKLDKDINDFILNTKQSIYRANLITNQLISFSEEKEMVMKRLDIRKAIKESVNFALHGSNVICEYNFADDLLQIDFDLNQISQVFSNLTTNAIQSMHGGGKIDVNIQNINNPSILGLPLNYYRNYIEINFQDHGTGIPSEILPKIFDPYFTTKSMKSGLGLSTCYSIIKKHNGIITVDSKVGQGSIFHIYLPANDENEIYNNDFSDSTEKYDQKKQSNEPIQYQHQLNEEEHPQKRVLVLDDDEGILKLLNMMFNQLGFQVILTSNCEECINLFRESVESSNPFQLVILDLTIPGEIGGKNVVSKLKNIDPSVKAIVSTGYINNLVVKNYKEYGFSGKLIKPYSFEQLQNVIDKINKKK
ncbi:MAG: PAS domain S-box protein [Promethearchaeota archaeon]